MVFLAELTRHRIITTRTPEGPSLRPMAELIHDALIRDWGRLRELVSQDRRFQEWFVRAHEQQARWADRKHEEDLLAGTALVAGLELSHQRRLPAEIAHFLTASKQHQQAAIRRSRRLNAILAGLLVIALIAGAGALWQWRTAETQRREALSRQLAGQSSTLPRVRRHCRHPHLLPASGRVSRFMRLRGSPGRRHRTEGTSRGSHQGVPPWAPRDGW
ncbi:hypothetical protein [Streptomyces sp. NPDC002209]|uniref:nSTAND1 domain-containing NTPase n=1 Tax=Streptomyces sp. NPDC002209 TaxID=3364638 RepID=UPI0036829E56